ncbi:MAG: hypothetical protein BWY77_01149 [bacterium ADurb.Bin431]|nr:MAG: hypothetical protein BWY77_01149 [bacterium ADurb.Bin431]
MAGHEQRADPPGLELLHHGGEIGSETFQRHAREKAGGGGAHLHSGILAAEMEDDQIRLFIQDLLLKTLQGGIAGESGGSAIEHLGCDARRRQVRGEVIGIEFERLPLFHAPAGGPVTRDDDLQRSHRRRGMTPPEFLRHETGADDIGLLARGPVSVSGDHHHARGKPFHPGIGGVGRIGVVLEQDAVLPLASPENVLPGAEPADPVAPGRAALGHIAEGDEETAVAGVLPGMAVAGEGGGQLDHRRPAFALVIAGDIERVELAAVFAQQHQNLLPVRRAEEARLTGIRPVAFNDGLGMAPGQPAV